MEESTVTAPDSRGPRKGSLGSCWPQLYVLLHCDALRQRSTRHLLEACETVTLGRGVSAERSLQGNRRHLAIRVEDPAVSVEHAVLHRIGPVRWVIEDAGAKNGMLINGQPAGRAVLRDGDVIEIGRTFLLYRDAVAPVLPDVMDLDVQHLPSPAALLRTFSSPLAETYAAVQRSAAANVPVMLTGDVGTGKEVVARALHELSRRPGAFVAVNCGALPPTLLEAAIFGHRRGAFSGADEDRPGVVRSAHQGTLLLDEIGDLPAASQTAFLRVLQEHEVVPVGEAHPVAVDVRVVTATHRSLAELVAAGAFRADLLSRISGVALHLPRLVERREDLGLLIGALLDRLAPHSDVRLSRPAARALLAHTWPYNVRELEKCLMAALAVAVDGKIEVSDLPKTLAAPQPQAATHEVPPPTPLDPLREELIAQLAQHRGNVAAVARAMGKGRMQIHRWVKRYALALDSFRR